MPTLAFAQSLGDPLKDDALRGFLLSYARAAPPQTAREALLGLKLNAGQLHRSLVRLAQDYNDVGRFKAAAWLYRDLLNEAPRSAEAPLFQARLLGLTAIEGRRAAVVEQTLALKKTFTEVAPSAEARDLTERQLSALVVAWHRERPDVDVENANRATDTLYSTYLELFPTGDKSYQLRFFRAEFAFGQLHDYRLAAELYTQVLMEDVGREKPGRFMELAAYDAILAWDELAKSGG
ncbi:MAG: hypothetical protein QM723_38280 [Myxococcaceae bacterium]